MDKFPKDFTNLISRFSKNERDIIDDAYLFAKEKHKDQKRKSGEPYIIHPINIATHLARDGHDFTSIVCALLHDTVEDTKTTYEEIAERYGHEFAKIVDGVTKVSSIKIKNKQRLFSDEEMFLAQVDNYRKILLATVSDLRVIVIKLYDRLHNIETIEHLSENKKKFYARETIEIYAPIAERLGMGELKGRLEDLSFPYAYPKEYEKFILLAKNVYKSPQKVIAKVIPEVENTLQTSKITPISIKGRSKHLYSLYLKLKQKKDISLCFDIVALRVIVDNIEDCYKTLGAIHGLYKPMPGRIFDYIARPRSSGYQSIHTTVQDNKNNLFEIQIRTMEMHQNAEYGSCAHWNYKGSNNPKATEEWLSELKKIEEIQSGKDLIKTIKEELFSKKVFVFTPTGEIIDLPAGSTPIDFAYRVHSDVGNHCKGAKINGRIAPLKSILETGDVITILTSPAAKPSKDWLKFAKTSGAKNRINHFVKEHYQEEFSSTGLKLINLEIEKYKLPPLDKVRAEKLISNSKLSYNSFDAAIVAIGQKMLSKNQFLKIVYPGFTEKKISKTITDTTSNEIIALKNIRHSYAYCCKPRPKDIIVGYLTKNHIIKVHRKNCKRISKVNPDRLFEL